MNPFRWNPRAGRYVRANGRFVPNREVRHAIDVALDRTTRRIESLALDLRNGKVSLADWQRGMAREIKNVHIYSGAAARGGWAQLTQGDYGRIGRTLRDEYGYLDRFAQNIHSGRQPLDGRFVQRTRLYAQAGRRTYELQRERTMGEVGMTEQKNVLHAADHCDECVAETLLGWQPIGTLVPVGQRQCLSQCRCTMAYRGGVREGVGERSHVTIEGTTPKSVQTLDDAERLIRGYNTEYAYAFNDRGKRTLFKTSDAVDYVDLTEKQVRALRDKTFTHNHPSDRSFSSADLAVAAGGNVREMRAVGKGWTHSITRPASGWPSPNELTDAYASADREVFNKFNAQISRGAITVEDAEAHHAHEVMNVVARKLNLSYTRTPYDPD